MAKLSEQTIEKIGNRARDRVMEMVRKSNGALSVGDQLKITYHWTLTIKKGAFGKNGDVEFINE